MGMDEETPEAVDPIIGAARGGDAKAVSGAGPAAAAAVEAATGKSALAIAADLGHVDVVKALLAAGATNAPSERAPGWTPAMAAADRGHAGVLAALVAALGAPCLAPIEGTSLTPLLLAALKGHAECVSLILDAAPAALGSDADAAGRTPLILAASGGSVPVVELLVARGAAVDATSADGRTPLMWAILATKVETVGALARLGADPTLRAAPQPDAPIVPGKPVDEGSTAMELSEGKRGKDPSLRHIAAYMRDWLKQREEAPGSAPPPMPPLPWVAHAVEFAARPPEEAAPAPDEATPAPASSDDIWGADEVEPPPADGAADGAADGPLGELSETEAQFSELFLAGASKMAGGAPPAAPAADEDLDDLD